MQYDVDEGALYQQKASLQREVSTSQVERIAERLGEQNRRLEGILATINDTMVRLRGERGNASKGIAPRPVRSGLLGTVEDQQDSLGERLDALNELASEFRAL